MGGISNRKDVLVLAATNNPEALDKSFLTPGRFDRILYVPPPDEESRKSVSLYRKYFKG
jgi:transitional endoplasmic reticulum ATPase